MSIYATLKAEPIQFLIPIWADTQDVGDEWRHTDAHRSIQVVAIKKRIKKQQTLLKIVARSDDVSMSSMSS